MKYKLSIEIVKTLIVKGAKLNAKTKEGHTPLALARMRGNMEIVGILDSAGARSIHLDADKASSVIRDFSFAGTKTPPIIHSYGWRHANLKATDGTAINVDYNVFRSGDEIIADPIWVNVLNPVFSGDEKVRVVLTNYFDSSPAVSNPVHSTQILDLKYAGQGRFSAQPNRVMMMQPEMNFRQEIAVVIDRQWLTDPTTGSHNFKFKMDW
ncbi:MAG: hypothetical protein V1913_11060 [Fibrobacterota bacterium]